MSVATFRMVEHDADRELAVEVILDGVPTGAVVRAKVEYFVEPMANMSIDNLQYLQLMAEAVIPGMYHFHGWGALSDADLEQVVAGLETNVTLPHPPGNS